MIRTFLAFDLPDNIKNSVIEIKNHLQNYSNRKIKWVEDENLHITLQFMGDIKESDIKTVANGLQNVLSNLSAFEFSFAKMELIPGREPRLVWLKFETESNEIFKRHKRIRTYLYEMGYKIEKKPLKFHLTLGRIKKPLDYYEIESFLKFKPKIESFVANNITLYKSFLTPKGPIYTPLDNFILK